MNVKVAVLIVVLLSLVVEHRVEADFYFNHVSPKHEELEKNGLKCIPGRTIIKIEMPEVAGPDSGSSDEYDGFEADGRRTHMNFPPKDEHCKVCVCSAEGKNQYCSKRPAMNVNECIRMSQLMDRFNKNMPFDHERDLAWRIRRDYIWHNDEIPYEAKARCKRGHSYYSNSITANETDIDVASDIESLLDYSNKEICYYCVCAPHGGGVGCISRSPWFCEYYRIIREEGASRDMYRQIFQQDRPTYFRQLSYRLRRTMDNGIFDLVESGGDTLCCGHPNGHRRNLLNQVRNKIRQLKRKVPKENLMSGGPGGDYVDFIVNND